MLTLAGDLIGSEREVLRGVAVRPIVVGERARWDALVRQHHYLGLRALVGKSLRYVAVFDGDWLALIGWQGAALKCQARDRWIGWPKLIQYQRLHLVANNARFLILPGVRVSNLASRILALNLKRLSADWQARHGHPLLLAESFVDRSRFTGACYRAANWVSLGDTRGFAKSGRRYFRHGCRKEVFVYALHRRARRRLCHPRPDPAWRLSMQSVRASDKETEQLFDLLRKLPDVRKRRGKRHGFATVLAIAIVAVLAGARGYTAIAEVAGRLTQNQLKRVRARYDRQTRRFQAPSEPTIRRVLQSADVEAIDGALGSWLMSLGNDDDAIAIDGKTVKGAKRDNGTQVHLLSAVLQDQGVTIAQREVGEKTNEIPELKPLLKPLDIAGRVITADPLHTQRKTARYIVMQKKADYIFIVKDNQPNLRQALIDLDDEDFSPLSRDR